MNSSLKKNFIGIKPYVAGEQPKTGKFIKLNANENPYPPSPLVLKAIKDFDYGELKKYPDSNALELRKIIAGRYGLNENEVFAGNGSDDVLALSFRAFFNSGKEILYPDITYSFYPVWCALLEIPYRTVPVGEDFRIDPDDYAAPNGGVVIANPNAPTSIGEGKDFIRKILDNNRDVVVIVDEAYVDFSDCTCIDLIHEYDNLLVVQTMSKSRSLAGMRVGMAFGNKELISVLFAVKDSYNSYPLDSLAQCAAAASFKDEDYFKFALAKIMVTREKTSEKLQSLGFTVIKSSTNFIFCKHEKYAAKDILEYLKQKGIYVRYFDLPRISDYLRITVGTEDEMKLLTDELEKGFADFLSVKK